MTPAAAAAPAVGRGRRDRLRRCRARPPGRLARLPALASVARGGGFLTAAGGRPYTGRVPSMRSRSPDHARLGAAIRARRERLGLSQEALARLIGMDRTYLSGIERGERNPSYTNLLRIAAALELPLSRLQAAAERHDDGKRA